MALSRLVVHAANRSTTLNRQTGGGGPSPYIRRASQAVWDAKPAGKGPLRYGQMGQISSRQPKGAPSTIQKTTLERPRIGGFQDQAHLGLFVLLFGALRASGAGGSCAGVPRAAAFVFHGLFLILELSQFL
jgi:hypothetical protein